MKKMADMVCPNCKGAKQKDGKVCGKCGGTGLRNKNPVRGVEK